ncbi:MULTISPECIES: lytic transglycosylase domain-containing protein [unclassified Shinella]|uniref:lytic transglycosylase domain-containing protein n=1 Tax=Shinella TaxID=323620 RepID=UPI00225D40FE|nr:MULTISPECIES: lytic transglycosylase domain-containing protein [unclassified Shinella]MCO5138722.1 lytic transglycosylase domain-containing protein [Shinella sp.]MDC7255560.1 lytic transglycosylase domain-containing protein [Shinella sp. YE25]CAI0338362.1 Transglycosylase-like protein with SLT domain [Rhizobiaceae bacterium]CAK7256808.1 Transglycosylase-like protein with SLT domain [Shinella sp. WSC3-e]
MADTPVSRPARIATLACAGLLATLAGCASVADDATSARTVTPASAETTDIAAADGTTTEVSYAALPDAKPGTENTPDALPTPIAVAAGTADAAVPVSALAEARPVTGAAAATAALAGNEAAGVATATQQGFDTVIGVSVMEPGFDSGEPEGLEQLVASRKIVPLAKPALVSNAVLTTETRLLVPQAEQPFKKSGTPIDALISKYAALYGIPESLLHRVVKRESTYNPKAYNRGHYGLMQIKYATAKSMGYEGPAEGLFDAETNIKYAGKYLRGAWMVADDKNDGAVRLYAAGYYYHAKRKGLLDETGLR